MHTAIECDYLSFSHLSLNVIFLCINRFSIHCLFLFIQGHHICGERHSAFSTFSVLVYKLLLFKIGDFSNEDTRKTYQYSGKDRGITWIRKCTKQVTKKHESVCGKPKKEHGSSGVKTWIRWRAKTKCLEFQPRCEKKGKTFKAQILLEMNIVQLKSMGSQ